MTSVKKKEETKERIRRVSSCLLTYLLVLLLCRFAGGGYKGVRILMCVCIRTRDALRDTCIKGGVAGVTINKGQAYLRQQDYTTHYIYSHHTDRPSRFILETSLLISFASTPPRHTLPSVRLLLDLDPPFPIHFHPSTNPLTIAHVFDNRINKR